MERKKPQHIFESCEGSKQIFDMMCFAGFHAGVLCVLSRSSREQRYTRLADWTYIDRCAKAAATLPVFGKV